MPSSVFLKPPFQWKHTGSAGIWSEWATKSESPPLSSHCCHHVSSSSSSAAHRSPLTSGRGEVWVGGTGGLGVAVLDDDNMSIKVSAFCSIFISSSALNFFARGSISHVSSMPSLSRPPFPSKFTFWFPVYFQCLADNHWIQVAMQNLSPRIAVLLYFSWYNIVLVLLARLMLFFNQSNPPFYRLTPHVCFSSAILHVLTWGAP